MSRKLSEALSLFLEENKLAGRRSRYPPWLGSSGQKESGREGWSGARKSAAKADDEGQNAEASERELRDVIVLACFRSIFFTSCWHTTLIFTSTSVTKPHGMPQRPC